MRRAGAHAIIQTQQMYGALGAGSSHAHPPDGFFKGENQYIAVDRVSAWRCMYSTIFGA